uniref:Uncharacterized protein n=1 Tax=uncultured marine virus TaxID=186617 RepID=A0A0F7L519_9VIRU|nr:hypothetical protein [uncultured marine virus]
MSLTVESFGFEGSRLLKPEARRGQRSPAPFRRRYRRREPLAVLPGSRRTSDRSSK